MTYFCEKCNVSFTRKSHYNSHLKSNRHNNGTKSQNTFICECGKMYKHNQSLWTHKKKCNIVLEKNDNSQQEYKKQLEQAEKERNELRKQLSEILDKQTNTPITNIENQQNIETQNNVNIHINAFGHENMEYITEKVIIHCLNNVYNSVPLLIERIHFDPEHPENHNIRITNKKLPHASIMTDENKWKTVDRSDVIETMVDKGYTILDEKYNNNKDKIGINKQKQYDGFQLRYQDQDKEVIKKLKTETELMIINATRES